MDRPRLGIAKSRGDVLMQTATRQDDYLNIIIHVQNGRVSVLRDRELRC